MAWLSRLRLTEFALLGFPLGLMVAGLAAVAVAHGTAPTDLFTAVLVVTLCFFAVHVLAIVRCEGADQLLLPIVAALFALGTLVIATTRPEALVRQVAWLVLGSIVCSVVCSWSTLVDLVRRYRFSVAVAAIALILGTLVLGVDPNGSGVRIWVGIGDYLFQPSELVKVLMVAFLAAYLDEKRELLAQGEYRLGALRLPPVPYLLPSLVMLGASLVLFLVQRDLGIAFLFFGVFMAMLYAASGRGPFLIGGLLVLCGVAYLLYLAFPVAHLRVNAWLDPWSDPRGRGYQIIQGLLGFAAGGIIGVGPGRGASTLIPAAYTDYPLAVIGEEYGLLGTAAVVALYAVLATRGYGIALALGASYRGLLALGLTTVLGLQALIIIAGNLKLVPLTGVTLPFISLGGSSLLANFVIIGLLLRLSADRDRVGATG